MVFVFTDQLKLIKDPNLLVLTNEGAEKVDHSEEVHVSKQSQISTA